MTEIAPEMKFSAVEGIEVNRVPDGAMVYQNERERVHFLNPTALIVFELCSLDKTAGEIEAFIADAFGLEVAPSEAVKECLASLLDEGLVVCAPSSAAP
ncbi:hypothetical protein VW23_004500 [Devosia insulae DS-56]|uniref:PqqD family protein n=1 Tax=Devosia insulae DS-56 TaxID=1116389 RepID=A0A1E5XIU8_9HYPH|nr:hypothetical protein [Devosia insulae]OEO28523.1 hypothetical protein VW23_004500 [Devosia insulae DS-56]